VNAGSASASRFNFQRLDHRLVVDEHFELIGLHESRKRIVTEHDIFTVELIASITLGRHYSATHLLFSG
jgi:hypothetical protein